MSSIFSGTALRLSVFGQSHSEAIGMTLDGLPAGIPVDPEELQGFLNRRAPGQNDWSTPRREEDRPEFLCGLKDGRTCGAPLTAVIRNHNTRGKDYEQLRILPRPGHADYTAQVKYGGFQDYQGGGHFSGRLTAPLCVAGGIVLQMLKRQGITVRARVLRIADVEDESAFASSVAEKQFPTVSDEAGLRMRKAISDARREGDSVGGIVECVIRGVPAGIGEPMFDGVENRIAQLMFAVPAVKGIEFGAGFAAAGMRGSDSAGLPTEKRSSFGRHSSRLRPYPGRSGASTWRPCGKRRWRSQAGMTPVLSRVRCRSWKRRRRLRCPILYWEGKKHGTERLQNKAGRD